MAILSILYLLQVKCLFLFKTIMYSCLSHILFLSGEPISFYLYLLKAYRTYNRQYLEKIY